MTVGRRLVLTRTGLSISLSLATLEAVGRMKLDAFRRIGAGEDGTAALGGEVIRLLTDPDRIREFVPTPAAEPFDDESLDVVVVPLLDGYPLLRGVREETEEVERFRLLLLAPRVEEEKDGPADIRFVPGRPSVEEEVTPVRELFRGGLLYPDDSADGVSSLLFRKGRQFINDDVVLFFVVGSTDAEEVTVDGLLLVRKLEARPKVIVEVGVGSGGVGV